jgi:hypothetical protein
MARSERFELPTLGIEIRCSIQLSYERVRRFDYQTWRGKASRLAAGQVQEAIPVPCPSPPIRATVGSGRPDQKQGVCSSQDSQRQDSFVSCHSDAGPQRRWISFCDRLPPRAMRSGDRTAPSRVLLRKVFNLGKITRRLLRFSLLRLLLSKIFSRLSSIELRNGMIGFKMKAW